MPRIVSEIATALTSDVEQLNKESSRGGGLLRSLLRPASPLRRIEVPAAGWEVYILPDRDRELTRGSLGVVSQLSLPARPEYCGTPTVRTIKTIFTEGRRVSTVSEAPAAPTASVASGSDSASADPPKPATTRPASGPRATLRYHDDGGDHVFLMRKDVIKIGRGGSDAWVDVQLITTPNVSREHCWIRADANGRFFIRDVSTWGTSVNGECIPPAVRSPDGSVVEPGAEKEVPPDARIDVADALTIQFHAEVHA